MVGDHDARMILQHAEISTTEWSLRVRRHE